MNFRLILLALIVIIHVTVELTEARTTTTRHPTKRRRSKSSRHTKRKITTTSKTPDLSSEEVRKTTKKSRRRFDDNDSGSVDSHEGHFGHDGHSEYDRHGRIDGYRRRPDPDSRRRRQDHMRYDGYGGGGDGGTRYYDHEPVGGYETKKKTNFFDQLLGGGDGPIGAFVRVLSGMFEAGLSLASHLGGVGSSFSKF